jgi:hypothetical protein
MACDGKGRAREFANMFAGGFATHRRNINWGGFPGASANVAKLGLVGTSPRQQRQAIRQKVMRSKEWVKRKQGYGGAYRRGRVPLYFAL